MDPVRPKLTALAVRETLDGEVVVCAETATLRLSKSVAQRVFFMQFTQFCAFQ